MPGNQQQETMYLLLRKVLHLETLEDRIFDLESKNVELENKNIELEANYKILKSQLDKITQQSNSQNMDDTQVVDPNGPIAADDNLNHPVIDKIASIIEIEVEEDKKILNENFEDLNESNDVNPVELLIVTLNESEHKDVEEQPVMSIGQLDKVKYEVMDFDVDLNSNSNPAEFIDDQLLTDKMDQVKNKPTTSNIINSNNNNDNTTVEIDTGNQDKNQNLDIVPYKLIKNIVVSLKRIDPSLYLRTQKESSKKKKSLNQSKLPKKSVRHVRIVKKGEKPYYSCSVCKRQFSQNSSLNRHKMIHSGEKPYNCTICPKSFRAKDTLTIHTRSHTGERPYECSVCFKKFSTGYLLNLHNPQQRWAQKSKKV